MTVPTLAHTLKLYENITVFVSLREKIEELVHFVGKISFYPPFPSFS